jgi:hypothetical protein
MDHFLTKDILLRRSIILDEGVGRSTLTSDCLARMAITVCLDRLQKNNRVTKTPRSCAEFLVEGCLPRKTALQWILESNRADSGVTPPKAILHLWGSNAKTRSYE